MRTPKIWKKLYPVGQSTIQMQQILELKTIKSIRDVAKHKQTYIIIQIMCEKSKLYKRAITTILNCNQIKKELYVYFF